MHVTLNVKHADRSTDLEQLFQREQERITRRLGRTSLELVSIHCEVDRNTHQREAYASLTLNLPSGILNARGEGVNMLSALRHATDALLVELERHRHHARREQRSVVNSMAGSDALDAGAGERADDRSHTIRRTLGELHGFVRRELSRHREVLGRPDLADVEVADVVEEAVLRALVTAGKRAGEVPFDRWLLSCAYDVVVDTEEELARRPAGASLDDEIADDPAQDDLDVTQEILQRPHAQSVADVLPSADGDPDAEMNDRLLHETLFAILSELPAEQRDALTRVTVDGASEQDLARELGCSEAAIHARIESARGWMRSELQRLGYEGAA